MKDAVVLRVQDASQVAEARREVRRVTDAAGFSEAIAGKVAIIVTELATNIIKHATHGGEIIMKAIEIEGVAGVEVISLDKGPGIANVAEAIRDGFSTAGGSGTGLGAISRMSDVFDIHSVPGRGTAILSLVWIKRPKNFDSWLNQGVDVVCVPKPGEDVAGDGWCVRDAPPHIELMVVDGLGHGPFAAEAAIAAMEVFRTTKERLPVELMQAAHLALRSTRGAAMAIARIDCVRREIVFCGVGNIAAAIAAPGMMHRMMSYDGVVGDEAYKIAGRTYSLPHGAVVVMHSDGIGSHWSLDDYPGLLMKHPGEIAGVLYRDYAKPTDDATVMVARPPALQSYQEAGERKSAWLS